MNPLHLAVLTRVHGVDELLPVASSAPLIRAEKLMGRDPTALGMTPPLMTLPPGTRTAGVVYFWRSRRQTGFASRRTFQPHGRHVALATVVSGGVGLALPQGIQHLADRRLTAD